jgi:hypothetical protein
MIEFGVGELKLVEVKGKLMFKPCAIGSARASALSSQLSLNRHHPPGAQSAGADHSTQSLTPGYANGTSTTKEK